MKFTLIFLYLVTHIPNRISHPVNCFPDLSIHNTSILNKYCFEEIKIRLQFAQP